MSARGPVLSAQPSLAALLPALRLPLQRVRQLFEALALDARLTVLLPAPTGCVGWFPRRPGPEWRGGFPSHRRVDAHRAHEPPFAYPRPITSRMISIDD